MIPAKHFVAVLFALIFFACTDSDDLIFDERDSQFISVEAFATLSFDESSPRVKSDTINVDDSLIFLSNVYPSKAIRSQDVYWTLDGEKFSYEYSFKSSVPEPGLHKVAFVLIDYFGDTLSDTVFIYSAQPPVLNIDKFIPLNKTQGITPFEPVSFSWERLDQDSVWNEFFHFTLKKSVPSPSEKDSIIVDTILNRPYFSLNKKLEALSKYEWSVSAFNELDMAAKQTIVSSFFTSGTASESAILATISTSSNTILSSVLISVTNESGDTLYREKEFDIHSASENIYLRPLPPGKVTISASTQDFPDFKEISTTLNLNEGQVHSVDFLQFSDYTPPTIKSLNGKDTLDIQDTLRFLVKDGGGKMASSAASVNLDGRTVSNVSIVDDTLKVPLSIKSSWTYRILSVMISDNSGNKAKQTYYLRPNEKYSEEQE